MYTPMSVAIMLRYTCNIVVMMMIEEEKAIGHRNSSMFYLPRHKICSPSGITQRNDGLMNVFTAKSKTFFSFTCHEIRRI